MTASSPKHGFLDTSTVILLERLAVSHLPEEPVITAVTLAELSAGPLMASDDVERGARQARLQQAEADSTHCRSMPTPRVRSVESLRRCAPPTAKSVRAPTMP